MLVPPPSRDKGSASSARRLRDGCNSLGKDVPHVVRATVLGLAGLTVDQSLCRDGGKGAKPPLPNNMRAVVAFSRGASIHGTTCLSRPLTLSPKDDIVHSTMPSSDMASGASAFSGEKVEVRDASKGGTTRHVAVWASGEKTLGSEVMFETPLHHSEKRTATSISSASSAFAPKSFELLVALTEDTDEESKIAIPLGVASLAISGDECLKGESVTLDLPVMSLRQARPLASNKNGTVGFPLISISKKSSKDLKIDSVKRTSSFKRFFKSKTPTPSVSERKGFASAYSMDAAGDAIIRISLELAAKGSPLDQIFESRRQKAKTAKKPALSKKKVNPGRRYKKDGDASTVSVQSGEPHRLSKANTRSAPIPERDDIPKLPPPRPRSRSRTRTRSQSRSRSKSPPTYAMPLAETGESCSDETWSDDESWTVGSATFTDCESTCEEDDTTFMESTVESNVVLNRGNAECNNPFKELIQRRHEDDEYTNSGATKEGTLTFGEKCQGPLMHEDDFTTVSATLFGRKVHVPICAVLADDSDDEDITRKPSVVGPEPDINTIEERTLLSTAIFGQPIKLKVPGSQGSNSESYRGSTADGGAFGALFRSPYSFKPSKRSHFVTPDGTTMNSTLTESLTTRTGPTTEADSSAKVSKRSPKGVSDFQDEWHSSPRKKPSEHSELFEDSAGATMLDTVRAFLFGSQCAPIPQRESSSSNTRKYPTIIIPDEDDSTVGELTVTTLEKKLIRSRTPQETGAKPLCKNRSSSFKAPAHEKDYFLEYDQQKPTDLLHQRSAKSNKSGKSQSSTKLQKSLLLHGPSQNSAKHLSVEKSRELNLCEI